MSEPTETDTSEQPTEPTAEPTEPTSLLTEQTSTTEEVQPLTAENLTFGEGVEVDENLRDEFLGLLNDPESSPADRAQALLDLHMKTLQAASEASSQAWIDAQTAWQNEVRSADDIGGANLQATLGRVNRLVSEYGSPELLQVFDMTGAGNNVHVIRFLNNLAGQMTEGSPVSGTPAVQQPTAAQKMFPSMKG